MRVNGNGKAAIGQANDGRRLVNVLFGSIISSRNLISDGFHNMIVIMERNVSARERDYQGVF